MKGTGKVFALKILNKVEMLKRHQVCTHVPKKVSGMCGKVTRNSYM